MNTTDTATTASTNVLSTPTTAYTTSRCSTSPIDNITSSIQSLATPCYNIVGSSHNLRTPTPSSSPENSLDTPTLKLDTSPLLVAPIAIIDTESILADSHQSHTNVTNYLNHEEDLGFLENIVKSVNSPESAAVFELAQLVPSGSDSEYNHSPPTSTTNLSISPITNTQAYIYERNKRCTVDATCKEEHSTNLPSTHDPNNNPIYNSYAIAKEKSVVDKEDESINDIVKNYRDIVRDTWNITPQESDFASSDKNLAVNQPKPSQLVQATNVSQTSIVNSTMNLCTSENFGSTSKINSGYNYNHPTSPPSSNVMYSPQNLTIQKQTISTNKMDSSGHLDLSMSGPPSNSSISSNDSSMDGSIGLDDSVMEFRNQPKQPKPLDLQQHQEILRRLGAHTYKTNLIQVCYDIYIVF